MKIGVRWVVMGLVSTMNTAAAVSIAHYNLGKIYNKGRLTQKTGLNN